MYLMKKLIYLICIVLVSYSAYSQNPWTPYATSTALRAGSVGTPDAVILTDKQGYTFRYNPSNTTAADDSAMTIRYGARRYERVTSVLKPEFWGAAGDMVADDYAPIQKCWNYVKISGLPVVMERSYKFTKQLRYTQNAQFSSGIHVTGGGMYQTQLLPTGITGAAIYIDGNTSGTNGYHMNDVSLKGFSIIGDQNSSAITHGIEVRSLQNSTLENIFIKSMKGDGIRVIATTGSDTGACEVMNFKNLYIQFCAGWGFNVTADPSLAEAVPLTLSTLDHVFVNTCGEGMYFQGTQTIKLIDCVSVNANTYNLRFGRGTTPCHLTEINGMELGNNFNGNSIPTATALSMEYIQQFKADRIRIINNSAEVIKYGIEFGSQPNSYIFGVRITNPWIVNANTNLPNYELFHFGTNTGPVENVTLERPYFSAFESGKVSNNISKFSYYSDLYNNVVTDYKQEEVLHNVTNSSQSSITPNYDHKSYLISSNGSSPLNIVINNPAPSTSGALRDKYPNQTPKSGETMIFVIRNFAGLSTITFGSNFKVVSSAIPTVGSHKVFKFRYIASSNEWYQE